MTKPRSSRHRIRYFSIVVLMTLLALALFSPYVDEHLRITPIGTKFQMLWAS